MTIFYGARRDDDPGLDATLLAAGGTIDVQTRRRSDWPERAMRRINIAFWVLFWLLGIAVVAASLMVLS